MLLLLLIITCILVPIVVTWLFKLFNIRWVFLTYTITTVILILTCPFIVFLNDRYINPPKGPQCGFPEMGSIFLSIILLWPTSLVLQYILNKRILASNY